MSDPSAARPVRKVAVADHIWNAYEQMAHEMGSDRDALINQAMFMFARLNGFLEAGLRAAASAEIPEPAPAQVGRARPAAVPEPEPEPDHGYEEPAHPEAEAEAEEEQHEAAAEEEPLEEEQAAEAHDDGGYEEEPVDPTPLPAPSPTPPPRRSMSSGIRPPPRAEAGEPPVVEPRRRMTELAPSIDGFDGPPAAKLDDDPVRREVAERVLETAAELERLIKGKQQGGAEPRADAGPSATAEKGLYLVLENGDTEKVAKDRYLIGRGKHCDFVINSGKVSREHAAILRDGAEYFIEDLGSSNGTWYNKARIKRRKVEDGDEYFICSEKIKFVVR